MKKRRFTKKTAPDCRQTPGKHERAAALSSTIRRTSFAGPRNNRRLLPISIPGRKNEPIQRFFKLNRPFFKKLMNRMKGKFRFRFHSHGVENSFSTPVTGVIGSGSLIDGSISSAGRRRFSRWLRLPTAPGWRRRFRSASETAGSWKLRSAHPPALPRLLPRRKRTE